MEFCKFKLADGRRLECPVPLAISRRLIFRLRRSDPTTSLMH